MSEVSSQRIDDDGDVYPLFFSRLHEKALKTLLLCHPSERKRVVAEAIREASQMTLIANTAKSQPRSNLDFYFDAFTRRLKELIPIIEKAEEWMPMKSLDKFLEEAKEAHLALERLNPIERFLRRNWVTALSSMILIFTVFIWPTLYKPLPSLGGRIPMRQNRITGEVTKWDSDQGQWVIKFWRE